MTLKIIKERVTRIDEIKINYELAHRIEDDLYTNFVSFISKNKIIDKDIRKMALEVLKTKEINYSRYCA